MFCHPKRRRRDKDANLIEGVATPDAVDYTQAPLCPRCTGYDLFLLVITGGEIF
jgi:hypothetical protein